MIPYHLFIIGALLIFFPICSVLLSGFLAKILKIKVNESSSDDYYIGKWNIGKTIYKMFMMGWFGIITIPLGLIIFVIGLVWYFVR